MKKAKSSDKLKIMTLNPPSEEEAKKIVEQISEFLRVKYYS